MSYATRETDPRHRVDVAYAEAGDLLDEPDFAVDRDVRLGEPFALRELDPRSFDLDPVGTDPFDPAPFELAPFGLDPFGLIWPEERSELEPDPFDVDPFEVAPVDSPEPFDELSA